jgi:hypothetical protein
VILSMLPNRMREIILQQYRHIREPARRLGRTVPLLEQRPCRGKMGSGGPKWCRISSIRYSSEGFLGRTCGGFLPQRLLRCVSRHRAHVVKNALVVRLWALCLERSSQDLSELSPEQRIQLDFICKTFRKIGEHFATACPGIRVKVEAPV